MGFYNDRLLPHLIALTMRGQNLVPYRKRVVSQAAGRVLEVGIGAGANLLFYSARVREIVGLDPSPRLVAMARSAANGSPVPVTLVEAAAEEIPLDDASIDTVILTWTLCSVRDASRVLAEARRVLKSDGRVLFVEHGLAPEDRVRTWQHRLTPIWRRIAGGCRLNSPIKSIIEQSGLRIESLDTGYMPGPKPMTYMYEGSARPN